MKTKRLRLPKKIKRKLSDKLILSMHKDGGLIELESLPNDKGVYYFFGVSVGDSWLSVPDCFKRNFDG